MIHRLFYKSATASKLAAIFGLVVIMVISVKLFVPAHNRSTPTWTHVFSGDGMVLSIIGGRGADRREIVVAGGYAVSDNSGNDLRVMAFDAEDGEVLWEQRESRSIKPYMNLEPRLAFDDDGHVLVGSEYNAIPNGRQKAITKRSSLDGAEKWVWSVDSMGERLPRAGSGFLAIPAAASRARIWVSGIRSLTERSYERFVAMLDSKTGHPVWLVANNEADDVHDQPVQIHPLSNADAFVLSPPRHHERSYPWVLQRIEEATGATLWRHELKRDNERNLPWIRSLVDEGNRQVLVFWQEVIGGSWKSEVISFDLVSGVQRWRNSSPFASILAGGVIETSLDASGNCILWGREEIQKTHVNWLKWHTDPEMPIPFPEARNRLHVKPVKLTLSPADGSVISKEYLSDKDESPTRIHLAPDTRKPAVMFLRTMQERAQLEPWGSIRLDGRVSLPLAFGPSAKLDYPRTATVTSSGRIITTGDPTEESRKWIIHAW